MQPTNKEEELALLEKRRNLLIEWSRHDLDQANKTFQKVGSQLILVAGFFLAFSTSLLSLDVSMIFKVILFVMIVSLSISLIMGVLQFVVDHDFYSRAAVTRKSFADSILIDITSMQEFRAANKQFNKSFPTQSSSMWLNIQLLSIFVSVVLGVILIAIKLF